MDGGGRGGTGTSWGPSEARSFYKAGGSGPNGHQLAPGSVETSTRRINWSKIGAVSLNRLKIAWSGWPGQPGYTQLYFDPASPVPLTAVSALLTTWKAYTPNSLSWSIPNGGDTIDETTGDLTGSWSNGSAAIVTGGGGGGSLVGSSGAVISWRTSSIIDGHRPHGRTYVVPMLAVAFDTDGTITSSCQTTLLNGALSFVTAAAGAFEVWHRPKRDPNPPHAIIRPGGRAPVTGALVPDLAAVMRSRRQ